jgi:hypothetical protein
MGSVINRKSRGCALFDRRKYPAIPHIGFRETPCDLRDKSDFERARS